MHLAATYGHKGLAEFLLANGAEVNARDDVGGTPLHYAADRGYKKIVQLLQANNAQVNARDRCGVTPLGFAASKPDETTVNCVACCQPTELESASRRSWLVNRLIGIFRWGASLYSTLTGKRSMAGG